MKGLIAVVVLMVVTVSSCAATFTVRGTAPTQDNAGTCVAPSLIPTAGGLVRVRLSWSGPVSGQDSVTVPPGAAFTFSRTVPSGNYLFVANCADSLGNVSCDATLSKLIRGSFDTIRDLR
jgi:hypothetical protein